MIDPGNTPETRQRLLDAAGEVFADLGFRNATVRDICARAGANVAAVNYHFGDKEKLYNEVLRYASTCAMAKYADAPGATPDPSLPAEDRLRLFIHDFLMRIFDTGRPAWQGKLMTRELVDPTPALDYLVANQVGPIAARLSGIIREIVGPAVDTDPALLRRCLFSVISQCVFYHHAKQVITRLDPTFTPTPATLAPHIATFSIAGLKAIAQSAAQPSPTPAR